MLYRHSIRISEKRIGYAETSVGNSSKLVESMSFDRASCYEFTCWTQSDKGLLEAHLVKPASSLSPHSGICRN